MRAVQLCQNLMDESLQKMHRRRLAALWFAVACLVRGRRLTLTALGRAAEGLGHEKHHIKRVDRLLGNCQLQGEQRLVYAAMAALLLKGNKRPVLVVDWTCWREGFHALTAAVPVGGKCVPIYAEVHPERRLTSPQVHRRFLAKLASILPGGVTPVVVTDGGFRKAWIDDVLDRGWDYVARVRGNVCILDLQTGEWRGLSRFHAVAGRRPTDLGHQLLGKVDPRPHRLIAFHKPPRRRRKPRVWRNKPGAAKRANHVHNTSTNDQKYRDSAAEPWILATSLACHARDVVAIYRTRMQTEETYRGLKSHAYGWSFEDARSTTAARLEILMLIGALATLVVSALGCIAEWCGLHRRYQANTSSDRTLSWFYLGIRICGRQDVEPRPPAMRQALAALALCARSYFPRGGEP